MFSHNKRLQYTVRVDECNPGLANLMLEQFGGPQGELAAACRYFSQYLAEDDPGRKDMLIDIATEELSHLEVIGTIVAMLNKGAKGRIAEGTNSAAELYRDISGGGNDSHITQVLFGGGPCFTNSGGVPWTAAYIDTIGEPTADLRSNIAAEARAKIVYERLINCTDDPGVKEALGFLMTREIAHQQSFEKALYSIQPNFPVGKLPRDADAIIDSAERARDVAIIGSSFIGLEVAASLQQRKLRVRVVTPEVVPLEKLLGADIGRMIQQVHQEKGIQFHFGRKATSYDGETLTLDDDSVIPADFVVLGLGVTPRTDLAAQAGIQCENAEQGGGIVVDEHLETSVPGIFAIGDVARYPDPHSGQNIRVEHWVHAERQGQHAARVIMGQIERFSDLPFFWSAHFDTGLRYLGHVESVREARTQGTIADREFSRLLIGQEPQKAFITCERELDSLRTEAEWDPKPR